MAGSIVEGEIKANMFVRVPLGSEYGIRLLIRSVEVAQRKDSDGEDVCLCIWAGPNMMERLNGLNIRGRTFEVKAEGGEE